MLEQGDSIETNEDISASFSLWLNRLHKGLKKHLGPLADRYRIDKTRAVLPDDRLGSYRYSLPLRARQIEIQCEGFEQTLDAVRANLEPRPVTDE